MLAEIAEEQALYTLAENAVRCGTHAQFGGAVAGLFALWDSQSRTTTEINANTTHAPDA